MKTERHKHAWFVIFMRRFTDARLSNIHLGVTNMDPAQVKPDVEKDNFDVCATWDGAVGAGVSQPLRCMAKGRYVIIQLQKTEYLTLCEVKVYAGEYKICSTISIASDKMQQNKL